jgi:hypothetical protein
MATHIKFRVVRPVLAAESHQRFISCQSWIENRIQRVGEDACDFTLGGFEIVEDRWSSQDGDDGSDDEPVKGYEWFEDGDGVDVRTVQG